MSHARIEEVSDSDPEIDDPESFLPDYSQHALQPMDAPIQSSSSSSHQTQQQQPINPSLLRDAPPMNFQSQNSSGPGQTQTRASIKTHCILYPLYFDSARTRSQGRRVTTSLSTPNPLAYNILVALRHILSTKPGPQPLQLTLEPDKTHPKDWANPGRVRIKLFSSTAEGHSALHPEIKNKAQLYKLVGEWLHENPTQKEDPLELKIPGLQVPENFMSEEVQPPRGWKMGKILPVHSAAVSGGGVSENFFKEAMEEMKAMGAQGGGGAGGMPGAGGGGMPDMAALQNMMGSMGGLGGMMGGGGGGAPGGAIEGGKKGKGKKK